MDSRDFKKRFSCAIAATSFAIGASAATFVQTEIQPLDLRATAHFGRSVAAGGNILAAGAFTPTDPGAVYVYQRNGDNWIQQAELHAPTPAPQDEFGLAVVTDGTTLVVGSRGSTAIYTVNNGVWNLQTQLAATGIAVSVSRDTAAIASGGQVFVLRRSSVGSWTVEAALAVAQGATSVALDGDTLIAGSALASSQAGAEVGTAFVFQRNGAVWSQQAALNASDPAAFAMFGFAAAISGDTAVIGAPGDGTDVLNERSGSAYVFVRNNGVWSQQAELFGIGASDGSNYGTGLALIGNTLAIGAYDDDNTGGVGSAFLYTRNGSSWVQTAELIPQGGATGQRFANTVAMADANTFVFGSPNVSSPEVNGGAVYVFAQH